MRMEEVIGSTPKVAIQEATSLEKPIEEEMGMEEVIGSISKDVTQEPASLEEPREEEVMDIA